MWRTASEPVESVWQPDEGGEQLVSLLNQLGSLTNVENS